MLFDVLVRLLSASVITTVAYTLLGKSPMDCFAVFALMFLIVWPQEWVIDRVEKYITERRQGLEISEAIMQRKRNETRRRRCGE